MTNHEAQVIARRLTPGQRSTITHLDHEPALLGCSEPCAIRLCKPTSERPALVARTLDGFLLTPEGHDVQSAMTPAPPVNWRPIAEAPADVRVLVSHELDPSSRRSSRLFNTTGTLVAGQWQCTAGFICNDGLLRFVPTHWSEIEPDATSAANA